jgi:hypothetical protein
MTNSNNKPCVKCGSTERHKPPLSKKLGTCKACKKARDKAWYKANSEKNRDRTKAWKQANPEKNLAHFKTYKQNNPEKYAAHNAVNNAIKRGDLPQVSTCDCVDCDVPAVEYHHEDYSKPLEVVALCKKCHAKRHHPSTNELTNHSHQTRQAQYV